MFSRSILRRSSDFDRISRLPRREWNAEQMEQCADHYTQRLRTPGGQWKLRPLQGVALYEIETVKGLLGPIRVGGGKTLLSLLTPRVLRAVRPILLLPAALIEKTKHELGQLMRHWDIPRNIQMQSYEMLGRDSASRWLEQVRPDCIIADEAHRLKNAKAGVTRRVARFMHDHPETVFIAISGTLVKDDLRDFAHLARWALKGNAPVPLDNGELMEWSEALAHQRNPMRYVDPGPLLDWATDADRVDDRTETARRAYARRLRHTPGVVASGDEHVSCSLYVQCQTYNVSSVTEANFRTLRELWETPDGWALSQAVDVWRHAQELALGFHYVWDPRPPIEWLEARRHWAKFVREVLSHSRTLDTEFQVANACERGELDPAAYLPWRNVRNTFQVRQRPIWHDTSALELCADWMRRQRAGIVWVAHSFFGHELSHITGIPYFGEQGLSDKGEPIEKADSRKPVIASIRANSTGRNLQAWNKNLLTCPPTGAPSWEQLIGRTHRDGQTADEVTFDVLLGCRENWNALDRALAITRATSQTMGAGAKLLLADLSRPEKGQVDQWGRTSARWQATEGREG